MLKIRVLQDPGHGLALVCSLLDRPLNNAGLWPVGTQHWPLSTPPDPHWIAGDEWQASKQDYICVCSCHPITCITAWVLPPIGSVVILSSHGSTNSVAVWLFHYISQCGSGRNGVHVDVVCLGHPGTNLPTPHPWRDCLPPATHWYQEGWVLLHWIISC